MSLTSYQAAPPRIFRIVSMLILRKSKNVCSSESRVEKDNLVCVRRRCDFVDGWRKDPPGNKTPPTSSFPPPPPPPRPPPTTPIPTPRPRTPPPPAPPTTLP